ncbi:MAG: hypothetical protein HUU23_13630 [Caldilineales bacterium]|nr:hypothetical protein [Caldilineales bacterium]
MTFVDGILLVYLDQLSRVFVDFLVETHYLLTAVDLFDIPGTPALSAGHVVPITPAALRQFCPVAEFSFILPSFTEKFIHVDTSMR